MDAMPEGFRILLVDDSETLSGMMSYILESAGYETETAGDGMEALAAVHRRVPDLVLMAVRMPRLDGFQACRLLKYCPAARDVPLILLTSHETGAERMRAELAGADRCLSREGAPDLVVSSVRELLEGKTPRPAGADPPGGAFPGELDLLVRVNGILETRLFEAILVNEISRMGRELDDFESTVRAVSNFLRNLVPHDSMSVSFSDGVHSETVVVVPHQAEVPFRGMARDLAERILTEAGVPYTPALMKWTEVEGSPENGGTDPLDNLAPSAVCPVRNGTMVRGVLALSSGAGAPVPAGNVPLETILPHAFSILENAWSYRRISSISETDGLTGLPNVRHFRERLRMEHARARRYKETYAIMMLDIDHFKKVNDLYGHPVGDTVLRELAVIIKEAARQTDMPARYGGEEFILFMPKTTVLDVLQAGERLRKAVERKAFAAPSPLLRCTISIGIADYRPGFEGSEQEVIRRADQALYEAKRSGRNRVVCDQSVECGP
jgi:two-component system cell cycle response regulator